MRDMGAANDESFAFDSFADPAGLIMTTIIEEHCKASPNYQQLLDKASSLHLPTNPLVRHPGLLLPKFPKIHSAATLHVTNFSVKRLSP